jgi:D-Tyr-tRNAtyr deacylase
MENEYGPIENTNYTVGDMLNEAEYQGRKVQLGKIMQGDIKKFKVYVKNDKGKVVKVNFGFGGKSAKGKRMVIKKNNPKRRKSFRARMNCDSPGPRWKPRYWACRTW